MASQNKKKSALSQHSLPSGVSVALCMASYAAIFMALCTDHPDKQVADTILQMPWTRSPALSNVVVIRTGRFRIPLFSNKEPVRNCFTRQYTTDFNP